jgi:hypothetical protein
LKAVVLAVEAALFFGMLVAIKMIGSSDTDESEGSVESASESGAEDADPHEEEVTFNPLKAEGGHSDEV